MGTSDHCGLVPASTASARAREWRRMARACERQRALSDAVARPRSRLRSAPSSMDTDRPWAPPAAPGPTSARGSLRSRDTRRDPSRPWAAAWAAPLSQPHRHSRRHLRARTAAIASILSPMAHSGSTPTPVRSRNAAVAMPAGFAIRFPTNAWRWTPHIRRSRSAAVTAATVTRRAG
jgi:hypothetical protein